MKRHNLLAIILCLSIISIIIPKNALASNVPDNTYFVSTQGSDSNPGTESKPWKTIQKASNTVRPGDNVYIRAGVYNERVNLKTSGSENNYITFMNYPGEVVTIDGTGIDWGYNWDPLFTLGSQDYIKIIGLKIINSRWFGIGYTPNISQKGCQNIVIQNCSISNTKGSGINFVNGSNITIDGDSVENACTGTASTQECISLYNVKTFEIKNNHVYNCTNNIPGVGGEGIDTKQGCTDGKISNNTVNDISKVGIYIDASSKHQSNIEVYGNKVFNSSVGIAVATESSGFLENVHLYENLVYNCVNWGFVIGGWNSGGTHAMKDITFNKNTIYNVGDGCIELNNNEAKNVIITNNILDGGSNTNVAPIFVDGGDLTQTTIDHNLLNRIVNEQPTGTNYTVGDPGFVNPTLADFHLPKNSTTQDIGCF